MSVCPIPNIGMVGDRIISLIQKLNSYFEIDIRIKVLPDLLLVKELRLVVITIQVAHYGRDVDHQADDEEG